MEQFHFEVLPPELILHICSFLEARFVLHSLSITCKRLRAIISDSTFWKARIRRRWPKTYPALPVFDSDFNWSAACVEREDQHKRWSNVADEMDYLNFIECLDGSSVDAIHLFQSAQFVACGTRGRLLTILDLSKLVPGDQQSVDSCCVLSKINAHQGWIWSIASCDNILSTASWDTHIKFWDLNTQDVVNDIKLKSAILCTHYDSNFYAAGGFDGYVYQIDPRTATVTTRQRYHKKSVLAIHVDDHRIVSASDDKTICVFDRHAGKLASQLPLPETPMCMSSYRNQLWVGSTVGNVTLVDATDVEFTVAEKFDVGHTRQVSGIICTRGALFTCSVDRTVKVFQPTFSPTLIANLPHEHGDVARIVYANDVLAFACTTPCVGIYRPKSHTYNNIA